MKNTAPSANGRSRPSRTFKKQLTFHSCVIGAAPRIISTFLTASGHYFKPNSLWHRRETTNTRASFNSIKRLVGAGSEGKASSNGFRYQRPLEGGVLMGDP